MRGVSPKSAAKFWINQRRAMDREFLAIQSLKRQFPGDPAVLARETTYYENKESISHSIEALPEKNMNALVRPRDNGDRRRDEELLHDILFLREVQICRDKKSLTKTFFFGITGFFVPRMKIRGSYEPRETISSFPDFWITQFF